MAAYPGIAKPGCLVANGPTCCFVLHAGGRTARNVNPIAWDKGLVFCQCGHCEVWHTLAANNPDIYEEILYDKVEAAAIRAANSVETAEMDISATER